MVESKPTYEAGVSKELGVGTTSEGEWERELDTVEVIRTC